MFLIKNKSKIKNLFLTGDIFRVPSLSRWESLYNDYEKYFNIYISPGNHDVDLVPLSQDVFDLYVRNKQPKNFPFVIYASGFQIVVDDSNTKKTILAWNNEKLKELRIALCMQFQEIPLRLKFHGVHHTTLML